MATHASLGIVDTRGFQNFQAYVILITTMLSWLGFIGLIGGGVRASYSRPIVRNTVLDLVACGYVAILVFLTGVVLTFAITYSESSGLAEPQRSIWPLALLLALLSWPIAAGFRVFRYRDRDSLRLRESSGAS